MLDLAAGVSWAPVTLWLAK